MNTNQESQQFLQEIIEEIKKKDKLHFKKIEGNIDYVIKNHEPEFIELLSLICNYFKGLNISTDTIATDYLRMINDVRKEGLYFYRHGSYRCKNQKEAYEQVYSQKDVMSYYMNALLISQVLWKHHFNIFIYFQENLRKLFVGDTPLKVLDVGPGHGFFSYLIKKNYPNYQVMDLVDISETSLAMTKSIIGDDNGKINYFNKDVFDFDESEKYDFIVLGEILEHLDDPKSILVKLSKLLSDRGSFWITTPTNAPALDHVYLFKKKEDIMDLVTDAGLKITDIGSFIAEDIDEETANKLRITNMVGLFCTI